MYTYILFYYILYINYIYNIYIYFLSSDQGKFQFLAAVLFFFLMKLLEKKITSHLLSLFLPVYKCKHTFMIKYDYNFHMCFTSNSVSMCCSKVWFAKTLIRQGLEYLQGVIIPWILYFAKNTTFGISPNVSNTKRAYGY